MAELTNAYTALQPDVPPECLMQHYLDLAWLDALLADEGPSTLRLDIDAAYLLLATRILDYQRAPAHHQPSPLVRQVGGPPWLQGAPLPACADTPPPHCPALLWPRCRAALWPRAERRPPALSPCLPYPPPACLRR